MPNKDISRLLIQPDKRYRGVCLFQGRTLTDSDWNESLFQDLELERLGNVALIGPRGTSDDGFLIGLPGPPSPITTADGQNFATYDFSIGDGSLYLGGRRLEASGKQRFLSQKDWIGQDTSKANLPEFPNADRNDLVYLEAWEQPVTATEDSELLEPALGGPDTSARVRVFGRVKVETDVAGDCETAFDDLVASLIQDGTAHFDESTCELVSNGRIHLGFTQGETQDPCQPAVQGGFLGADNQAVRIELRDGHRFIWGLDNAAPLYRVLVEDAGNGPVKIRFLTPPRDELAFPLKGQAVEILPWAAVLPNKEKTAEGRGFLATVENSYDPFEHCIELKAPVAAALVQWMQTTGVAFQSARDDHPGYFYLRLWTGGTGVGDGSEVTDGDPVKLGSTGLEVHFDVEGRPGDHWVVAVRPNTPRQLVPWELEGPPGALPVGTRRFYAPLAHIAWTNGGADVAVHDCRRRFRPLTELRGCCTITVGDGNESFGDFESIQEAVNQLPAEGGRICVLAGRYPERVVVSRKAHVVIEGCGQRSVLTNPAGDLPLTADALEAGAAEPEGLLVIEGSEDVDVHGLAVRAVGVPGIEVRPWVDPHDPTVSQPSVDVRLHDLRLASIGTADADPILSMPCVTARGVERLRLEDDRIGIHTPGLSPYPAVRIGGTTLEVLDCRVESDLGKAGDQSLAWGGIQILGGSEDVEIRGNRIRGGFGHGITLGSEIWAPGDSVFPPVNIRAFEAIAVHQPPGWALVVRRNDPCIHVDPFPPPNPGDPSAPQPFPDGEIVDLRIHDNRIHEHGGSGISVIRFWPLNLFQLLLDPLDDLLNDVFEPLFVIVRRAWIENNDIFGNARVVPEEPVVGMERDATFGGIALGFASDLVVRENRILENGAGSTAAICGIGAVVAENATIVGNRVRYNGGTERDGALRQGLRAGVAVRIAMRRAAHPPDVLRGFEVPRFEELALDVVGNRVQQPEGPALWLDMSFGAVRVESNTFECRDEADSPPMMGWDLAYGSTSLPATGTCVRVRCLSLSWDLLSGTGAVLLELAEAIGLMDGRLLFHDNQTAQHWTRRERRSAVVFLMSLDDVSAKDNQLMLHLRTERSSRDPGSIDPFAFLYHVVAIGDTTHLSQNRITEGASNAHASGLAVGLFSNTKLPFAVTVTQNHATHCLFAVPHGGADLSKNFVRQSLVGCRYEEIRLGGRIGVTQEAFQGGSIV